jgi:hypothetical protein
LTSSAAIAAPGASALPSSRIVSLGIPQLPAASARSVAR